MSVARRCAIAERRLAPARPRSARHRSATWPDRARRPGSSCARAAPVVRSRSSLAASSCTFGGRDRRLGLLDRELRLRRVEPEQQLALLHAIALVDRDRRDHAALLGAELGLVQRVAASRCRARSTAAGAPHLARRGERRSASGSPAPAARPRPFAGGKLGPYLLLAGHDDRTSEPPRARRSRVYGWKSGRPRGVKVVLFMKVLGLQIKRA